MKAEIELLDDDTPYMNETGMLVGILERAINDYLGLDTSLGLQNDETGLRVKKKLKMRARAYFNERDDLANPHSFVSICDQLEISPLTVIRFIRLNEENLKTTIKITCKKISLKFQGGY